MSKRQNGSERAASSVVIREPLSSAASSSVGALLGRAFAADPVLCHAEPDPARRARWIAALYGSLAGYASAAGGVELAGEQGAALWLESETQPSFWRGLLHGSLRLMFALGLRASFRCLRHEGWCAARVRALGFERYGYVWFLAVDPLAQRQGHGRRLLGVALEVLAARGHRVCLLKTETASNVGYYRSLGFDVVDEQIVPPTQLRYWLLRRDL